MMRILIPTLAAAALFFVGCASNDNGSKLKQTASDNEKKPEVGMTKEQVISLYGKTDNIRVRSDGETWIYNLNLNEAFIPWNVGYRPKLRIVDFDKDGKVKSWSSSK
jgi:hypothetical protein